MKKTLSLKKGEITLTQEKLILNDGFGKIRRNRMVGSSMIILVSLVFLWIHFSGRPYDMYWIWIALGLAHLGSLLFFAFRVVAPKEVLLSDIRFGRFVNLPSGRFLSLKLAGSRIRRVGPLGMEEMELKPALEELGITIK